MPSIEITEGVAEKLKQLDTFNGNVPDYISTRVMKETVIQITPMLTTIFNRSSLTGECSACWKYANVQAIYKQGAITDPANYRPVCLTSVTCKRFEHNVRSMIMKHLDINIVLVPYQHGFIQKQSCETKLI